MPAATDNSSSLTSIQFQHLLSKQNSTTPLLDLGKASYSSEMREIPKQSHIFNCFNAPKPPLGNVVTCDLMMFNQNLSNPYGTNDPNDGLQNASYGRSGGTNLGEENHYFSCDFNMEVEDKNSECFVQISQSNLQYLSADVDYHILSADNQCPKAIQGLEFAPDLTGGLYPKNRNHHTVESGGKAEEFLPNLTGDVTDENLQLDITSGLLPQPADSSNQNAALKELDDLLNNSEDPTGYCYFNGESNLVEIDRYYEWLNT